MVQSINQRSEFQARVDVVFRRGRLVSKFLILRGCEVRWSCCCCGGVRVVNGGAGGVAGVRFVEGNWRASAVAVVSVRCIKPVEKQETIWRGTWLVVASRLVGLRYM